MEVSDIPAEKCEQSSSHLWETVKAYEPLLRRAVRVHLTCAHARRLFDSIDICQGVYLTLWQRIQEENVHWNNSKQLFALLLAIARHKVSESLRYSYRHRRDVRRTHTIDEIDVPQNICSSPVEQAAEERELYSRLDRQLPEAERSVLRQRLAGASWLEANQGNPSNAAKLRIRRACSQLL